MTEAFLKAVGTMIPSVDYIRILPELVVSVFGIICMLVDPLIPEQDSKKPLGIIAIFGALAGLAATAYQTGYYGTAFSGTIQVDTFSVSFTWLCCRSPWLRPHLVGIKT